MPKNQYQKCPKNKPNPSQNIKNSSLQIHQKKKKTNAKKNFHHKNFPEISDKLEFQSERNKKENSIKTRNA